MKGREHAVMKVRDRLLIEGVIVNTATTEGRFKLWLSDDPNVNRSHTGTDRERLSFPHPAGDESPFRSPFPPIGNGGTGTDDSDRVADEPGTTKRDAA